MGLEGMRHRAIDDAVMEGWILKTLFTNSSISIYKFDLFTQIIVHRKGNIENCLFEETSSIAQYY